MSDKVRSIISLVAIASTVLASAASARETDKNKTPDPRIGEEVSNICFLHSISGWNSIKGDDHAVLLEKGVNDWYRAEVTGPCRESDFRSAITIGVESHPAGGCLTRGDAIIVKAPGDIRQRCIITKINKWDEKATPSSESEKEPDKK